MWIISGVLVAVVSGERTSVRENTVCEEFSMLSPTSLGDSLEDCGNLTCSREK